MGLVAVFGEEKRGGEVGEKIRNVFRRTGYYVV